jgi:hypothetical protein
VVHLAIRPSGPALSNAEDNGDLEKKKSKSTRTRLVARFSSVLASGDGGDADPTSVPRTGTESGIATGDTDAQAGENNEHGCTCCVVC